MCWVNPHIAFRNVKNFGNRNKNIGRNEPKVIDNAIVESHSKTNIRELFTQSFFLSSGMQSFITFVSTPKACFRISKCSDLCKVKKADPGTKMKRKLIKEWFANMLPSTS